MLIMIRWWIDIADKDYIWSMCKCLSETFDEHIISILYLRDSFFPQSTSHNLAWQTIETFSDKALNRTVNYVWIRSYCLLTSSELNKVKTRYFLEILFIRSLYQSQINHKVRFLSHVKFLCVYTLDSSVFKCFS